MFYETSNTLQNYLSVVVYRSWNDTISNNYQTNE